MAAEQNKMNGLISPFIIGEDGKKSVDLREGDSFIVTGRSIDGKRFRSITNTLSAARDLMLADSSLWLQRDGRKFLVERT